MPSHDRAPADSRTSILALTTTFPGEPGDGTPEFVLTLAREMSPDFDITILAPRVSGAPRTETIGDVKVRRFPYFPRPFEGLAEGAILPNLRAAPWRIIEVPFLVGSMFVHALADRVRRRPDLLHAHWIVPGGFVAAILKLLGGPPFILTVHGADVYGIRDPIYVRLRNWIVAASDAVLPVSDALAEDLEPAGSRTRLCVAPMGVSLEDVVGQNSSSRSRRGGGGFLFVGRLAEKKGVDVLLRACAAVPEARLVLIGSGPEENELRRLSSELGLDDRVEFRGRQPREKVLSALEKASVLVIPSRIGRDGDQEGTPVVLAEGAAMSVPIIASELGGLAERLEHDVTGILVEPESVEALASALRRALDRPEEMASLGEAAHAELLNDLDMRTTAERYGRVIREVLA